MRSPTTSLALRVVSRWPRRTVRLRLTIIYASLFLVSGAGLLAITYLLVHHDLSVPLPPAPAPGAGQIPAKPIPAPLLRERSNELHQLLVASGVALGVMAAVSILLGWLAAGRLLRPLRTLNERTREISASSLHKRLALTGPDDELTRLAGTFDDLLDRLEASFNAQRRFVANASHELRTPLTLERALLEANLTDPDATIDSFRSTSQRLLALGQQQEQLIDALLTLASSERGLERHDPFDLATLTNTLLSSRGPEIDRYRLHLQTTLDPASSTGDPRLIERLIANLLDNAIHHNHVDGHIQIHTRTTDGRAVLAISNTGATIPPPQLATIIQPFQRDRANHRNGHGLGLSIVHAITNAHHAVLTLDARPGGGLEVEISFPPPPDTGT